MPGKSFEKQLEIRQAIKLYIALNGVTTLRQMAVSIGVSQSTIKNHLDAMGYEFDGQAWRKVDG